jgi:hypothetical protein
MSKKWIYNNLGGQVYHFLLFFLLSSSEPATMNFP